MMLKKWICIVGGVLLAVLSGCGGGSLRNTAGAYLEPRDLYGITDTLRGEMLPEIIPGEAPFWGYYTPWGLLGSARFNGKLVHLLDSLTGKVLFSTCEVDKNSKFLSAAYLDYDPESATLYVADVYTNKIRTFRAFKDSIAQVKQYELNLPATLLCRFQIVNDSTFVLFTRQPRNVHRLYLINAASNTMLDSLDYHVFEDKRVDHSKVENITLSISMTPDRKNLIVHNTLYSTLRNYDVSQLRFILKKEVVLFEPHIEIKDGVPLYKDEHVKCDGRVFTTKDRIYIISNPETVKEEIDHLAYAMRTGMARDIHSRDKYILVFDYDFQLISSHVLDHWLNWMIFLPDQKTFYASTMRTWYESRLTKYPLP